MTTIEIKVPDIGDFADVTVIELMVKPGDTIKAEQSLITVESDKASMEIPSSHAGLVKEIKVALGDKVREGSLVLLLEPAVVAVVAEQARNVSANQLASAPTSVADQPSAPVVQAQAATDLVAVPQAATPIATSTQSLPGHEPGAAVLGLPHASPSVRKFARELGVPLNEVKGSGLKGRITDADVQAFTRSVMAGATQTIAGQAQKTGVAGSASGDGAGLGLLPWPQVDFAKFGPVERKDRPRIKKISAANLHRNWVMIPHVTNHDDADITELEAFRIATNKENESGGKAAERPVSRSPCSPS